MLRKRELISLAVLGSMVWTPLWGQELPPLTPGATRSIELVVVYLGATSCGPCLQESTKVTVRDVLAKAEERAAERSLSMQAVGAAFDDDIESGLGLLRSTAEFDQVLLGGGWSNAAAVEFIWSDGEVLAAIPHIVILTRSLDKRAQAREPASKSILVQLQGERQMRQWLDEGGVVFR
jgi:hypothetical protein